jgi:3-hydroxyisobutyrate dehydrogenase-like beta-hydroxyacid dehydrogenase
MFFGSNCGSWAKDIALAMPQGEELGVLMWVCQAARLVFKHAMHQGMAKEDLTVIVKCIERNAGFEVPKPR